MIFFSITDIIDYNSLVFPTDSSGNILYPRIMRPKGIDFRFILFNLFLTYYNFIVSFLAILFL